MSFLDLVFWILVIYVVYYSLLFITDAFLRRNKNNVSAIQVIKVHKPVDQPVFVEYSNYAPKNVLSEKSNEPDELSDTDDSNEGRGSLIEKKKLDNQLKHPQTMYDLDKFIADIPVSGQPEEINFCINQFLEATNEESLLRQDLRHVGNLVF